MCARRRTEWDPRRRSLGQHHLADPAVVRKVLRTVEVADGDLVVDLGAGGGALTVPLARTGARVLAVEVDPVWAGRLRARVRQAGVADRVRVVQADLRRVVWPDEPYRVVANPPFNLTTALLRRLLDDPTAGPTRADLIVQAAVARKRAQRPPTTLLSASWAPWWDCSTDLRIDRRAFRPAPRVDAALLTFRRRDPPILPPALAPAFTTLLRPAWPPR